MDYLTIEGVKPYDGRYEFDLENHDLTTREWGWIKRHSGYLPLTIGDGFEGGDPELYAAFAVVALHRAGKIASRDVADVYERIADAPFGTTITLDSDTVVEDGDADDPPALSGSANGSSSGSGSPMTSETSEPHLSSSGTSGSDASASAPARLAT